MTGLIDILTIGFTRTTAENFFHRLVEARARRVIDVRLHNTGQLAGFANARDLPYFLKVLGSHLGDGPIEYQHEPELAPTEQLLKDWRGKLIDWSEYEPRFLDLMDRRKIDEHYSPDLFDWGCLLCSEATPHHCHRRLIAEYVNDRWDTDINVHHL